MEGDVDKVGILKLGFEVKMVLEVLWLPEIPGSNENFASGFEVAFDLIKNKKLIFEGGQMMKDGNTKDVVVLWEMFPDFFLGNVGFDELFLGIGPLGFFKKRTTNIDTGVVNVLRQS